jgi:hypothetical protein
MPCKLIVLWIIGTIALALPAPAGLTAAAAQEAVADGEGGDDEDSAQRRGRLPAEEEPEEAQATHLAPAPTVLGASRRPDPFDAIDAPPNSVRPPTAAGDAGVVVCEAGCDGPRGRVVYHR